MATLQCVATPRALRAPPQRSAALLCAGRASRAECGIDSGSGGEEEACRNWRRGSFRRKFSSSAACCSSYSPLRTAAVRGGGRRRRGGIARAEGAASPLLEINESDVNEVDKDTFWPLVRAAGNKVVVLDMYTQWCGPCKLMQPQIAELAGKLDDVIFLKLDCNSHNKALAKELGVKSVPTFKIYKKNELVGEVKGAKFQELEAAVETARNG